MHPFKNFIIWSHSWRTWGPIALGVAFLIFMVVLLFDPGGPSSNPVPPTP
jgi:hypothetical protein